MQPEPEIEPEIEAEIQETFSEPVVVLTPARSTRDLWLEVLAVCFIAVLPDLWNTVGFLVLKPTARSLNAREVHLVFRSVQVSWLVLYLMARSGTPWSRFGIVAPRWIWDSLAAFGNLVTAHLCYAVYAAVVMETVSAEALRRDTHRLAELFKPPSGPEQTVLVIVACLANGFAEELVMRGYLIPRFEDLLGSPAKAILLSALLFASYHLYQGYYGAGSALVVGIVFGVIFYSTRRIWPLAAAHALHNILTWMS
jgi:membrane protease YdiL (CAAX protease family)